MSDPLDWWYRRRKDPFRRLFSDEFFEEFDRMFEEMFKDMEKKNLNDNMFTKDYMKTFE